MKENLLKNKTVGEGGEGVSMLRLQSEIHLKETEGV